MGFGAKLEDRRSQRSLLLRGWIGSGAALACALVTPALAQSSSALPTREELQQPPILSAPPQRLQAITADDLDIERAPCPLAHPDYQNIRFTLRSVSFTGSEFADNEALSSSWAAMQGQELPLSAVCDIRDHAATILRRQGYLATVRVPPQTIEDGNIRLDVLTAKLARIEVRGDAGANEAMLEAYLSHLTDQPAFNVQKAERALLLARDIPGMDARLTLRPGSVEGEVIGEVQVVRMPYMFDFAVQNYGTRDVGRWAGVARAQLAGLTGMGDLTTISYYGTPDFDEQKVLQLAHEMRLGRNGLRVGASYSRAWTRPDIAGLDIRSDAQIFGLFATYPLVLSQSRRVNIGGGFDVINQDVRFANFALNQDRLRVAYVRADAGWVDPASIQGRGGYSPSTPRWSLHSYIEARHGLSAFGASKDCGVNGAACAVAGRVPLSRVEGKPDAFLLRGAAQAEWRPHPKFTLSAAPRGQWAADPLLSYEEFSGGNFTVGRGYDAGTVIGDSGAAIALEARYGSGFKLGKKRFDLQPYVFFDAAKVWNKNTRIAALEEQHLYSAGAGLRASAPKLGRMDLTLAVPLNKAGLLAERPDPRLLASFSTFFGIRAR
jgi:hemolysin activation/secretion protein